MITFESGDIINGNRVYLRDASAFHGFMYVYQGSLAPHYMNYADVRTVDRDGELVWKYPDLSETLERYFDALSKMDTSTKMTGDALHNFSDKLSRVNDPLPGMPRPPKIPKYWRRIDP